ncbi:hypothetical protein [Arthrobacter sp. ISL-95]|uniref:hypothetical protein n=1 Tax=Arthrobacter sp. ISL-95 TaxID=2819116 RepID=UPI001BE9D8E8|nr:hypothetical protein [Arthrobacter sp. ISL-95]
MSPKKPRNSAAGWLVSPTVNWQTDAMEFTGLTRVADVEPLLQARRMALKALRGEA